MKIRIDESKSIEFDFNISGTDTSNIQGFLRLNKNGIEYGIPVSIEEHSLKVDVPKLESFISYNLVEGEKIAARLDIIANGDTYIKPWEDTFIIERPLTVEAKIKEVKNVVEKVKPTISIEKILDVKPTIVEEEFVIEKKKKKVKSKFGKTLEGE